MSPESKKHEPKWQNIDEENLRKGMKARIHSNRVSTHKPNTEDITYVPIEGVITNTDVQGAGTSTIEIEYDSEKTIQVVPWINLETKKDTGWFQTKYEEDFTLRSNENLEKGMKVQMYYIKEAIGRITRLNASSGTATVEVQCKGSESFNSTPWGLEIDTADAATAIKLKYSEIRKSFPKNILALDKRTREIQMEKSIMDQLKKVYSLEEIPRAMMYELQMIILPIYQQVESQKEKLQDKIYKDHSAREYAGGLMAARHGAPSRVIDSLMKGDSDRSKHFAITKINEAAQRVSESMTKVKQDTNTHEEQIIVLTEKIKDKFNSHPASAEELAKIANLILDYELTTTFWKKEMKAYSNEQNGEKRKRLSSRRSSRAHSDNSDLILTAGAVVLGLSD